MSLVMPGMQSEAQWPSCRALIFRLGFESHCVVSISKSHQLPDIAQIIILAGSVRAII